MRLDYFDMLSGEAIHVPGIGHLRSPQLRELCPSSGVGYDTYNLYLNFLSWDKESLLKYEKIMKYRGENKLHRDELTAFDVITLLKEMRELCRGVLSFFMVEDLKWDEQKRRFIAFAQNGDEIRAVGEINRNNFEEARLLMLQLNYVGLEKDDAPIKHSSSKSKELWERAQGYLKQQSEKVASKGRPEYRLSNIISKICAAHPSYNLLNIYDLTIFQLYDSFFQLGYMRSSNLSERIFSNHGGKKFNFEDWLKPILKNK